MLARRLLFGLSVAIAAALYALLFALAPRIEMMHAAARADRIMTRFSIDLRDPDQIVQPELEDGPAFRAGPGSVRDLLKMEDDSAAVIPPDPGPAAIPDLARRIGRAHVHKPPIPLDDSLRRVDEKILEITREAARRDVEVPRRLVRPSPQDGMKIEGAPALREEGVGDTAPRTTLPPSGLPSLLVPETGIPAGPDRAAAARPADSQPIVRLEPIASLPVLPPTSGPGRTPVARAIEQAREGRDFGFMDDLLEIELSTWRAPGEAEGYFEVRIVPKKGESIPFLPKDVTFVIDASSSIPQHKLNVTIKGVRESLRQLRPEDRFNVVAFRDTPQQFKPETVAATAESVAGAIEFLAGLESRGETDVYKALQPVVRQQPREGTPGVVVVVSDGRPTAGIQDGRTIINGLTADNDDRNGIYAFGGGRTVNRQLLDLLAYRNKGAVGVTENIDGIASQLPDFFAQLRDPILVDLRMDFGKVDESQVFPQSLPDFFQGQPVTLYGRYSAGEDDEFTLWLAGRAGAEKKEVVFRSAFDRAETGTRDIARAWAFQKAYDIIGRISREGESPALLDELKRLRAEYGVRTTYDQ